MNLELIKTTDGSNTYKIPEWDEHYHSKYGALTESMHLFIENGYKRCVENPISILEIGFGTGLNTILTYIQSKKNGKSVNYVGIEKYPLSWNQIHFLEYEKIIHDEYIESFQKMHKCSWGEIVQIDDLFSLKKVEKDLREYEPDQHFSIIYFDAFAPDLQPDLWTTDIFSKLYKCLNSNGILITYTIKGLVRRTLSDCGFKVEKIPGPKGGKRENLLAVKI